MDFRIPHWVLLVVVASVLDGCASSPVRTVRRDVAVPPPPPTLIGRVTYEDGTDAGAILAFTNLTTGKQDAVIEVDATGHFSASLVAGEYVIAATATQGFALVEKQKVPAEDAVVKLDRSCHRVTGSATKYEPGTRVNLARHSSAEGDIFAATLRSDRTFSFCVPEAHYAAYLSGALLSFGAEVAVPAASPIMLEGFVDREVRTAPARIGRISGSLAQVVADIVRRDAKLIGVGEATHGTAELTTKRSELTLELARRADLRLVLFEVDAIVATALDDYVNGAELDIKKAVAALGFWVTDTYEFLQFLEDVRRYNGANPDRRVHVWGIDAQNTKPPVEALLASATTLGLTGDERAVIEKLADKRAAIVKDMTPEQRSSLDQLLARLGTPRSAEVSDLRLAVAARSLAIQVGYLDGDRAGLYGIRRDAGMAALAGFIVERSGTKRACLWAHVGHVQTESRGGQTSMGERLRTKFLDRYYTVGFYMHEGSGRAWDAAGAVGVLSHRVPAVAYTVEAAVMAVTGSPDVAWVPTHQLATALGTWLDTPRFTREFGAVYIDEEDTMRLHRIPAALDAVVVVKTAHDSSPTPTGVRVVTGAP